MADGEKSIAADVAAIPSSSIPLPQSKIVEEEEDGDEDDDINNHDDEPSSSQRMMKMMMKMDPLCSLTRQHLRLPNIWELRGALKKSC